MKAAFIVLLLLQFHFCFAQRLSSSCDPKAGIAERFKNDADRLALRYFSTNNISFKDSINIPGKTSNIFFKALAAVYNATELVASDTVYNMLGISTHLNSPSLNNITIWEDSTSIWMKNLSKNKIPCGNAILDKYIETYNLRIEKYTPYKYGHYVSFYSYENINAKALAKKLSEFGIKAEASGMMRVERDDINGKITDEYTELIYTYGWMDCFSGCGRKRHWKFRVYDNCDVEYMGSYGQILELAISIDEAKINQSFSVYPNPFENTITISGLKAPFQYSISNTVGHIVAKGKSANNTIDNLQKLEKGIYILQIKAGDKMANFKLQKK